MRDIIDSLSAMKHLEKLIGPQENNDNRALKIAVDALKYQLAMEEAMYTCKMSYYEGDSCCYFCKYGCEGSDAEFFETESTTNAGSGYEWICERCDGVTFSQRGGWAFDIERFFKGGGED